MTMSSDIHYQHGQERLLPATEISLEDVCLHAASSVSRICKVQRVMGHLPGAERVPCPSKGLSHHFPKRLHSSAKSYAFSF